MKELKARREELKIKQQDLADQLGISRTQLSRYENGLREADERIIEKWKGILCPIEMDGNPNFDQLIDVARKGFKDGVVSYYGQSVSAVSIEANGQTRRFNAHFIKDGIDFVQSLYTEEFIIECEDDLKRIREDAKGVLFNGVKFIAFKTTIRYTHQDKVLIYIGNDQVHANFGVLKGATVKQKKS